MKKILVLLFLLPTICFAEHYISCPEGTLAFSSVSSYDKVLIVCRTNDISEMSKLLGSGDIRILDPGTLVKVQSVTELVAAVTIEGSTRLYAVPLSCIGGKRFTTRW
jgi:hypothetical protein